MRRAMRRGHQDHIGFLHFAVLATDMLVHHCAEYSDPDSRQSWEVDGELFAINN